MIDGTEEFDSTKWREARDAKLLEWTGDPFAVDYLMIISRAAEFFDDLVDRDKSYTNAEAINILFNLTVDLPSNPFFDRYKLHLIPVQRAAMNAWVDSIHLERSDDSGKNLAYVLRWWCIELVMTVVDILRGREYLQSVSLDIRKFFTAYESLDAYKEKL